MLDQIFASQTIGFSVLPTVLFSMLLAAVFGFLISWIYRRNYRGVMYSGNFSFTLIMMTLVTTPVVLCIRSSLALSMGCSALWLSSTALVALKISCIRCSGVASWVYSARMRLIMLERLVPSR